jgi:acyl-CoA hydrolase
VVSEFGMVNLFGKNIEERTIVMISLIHPDFRDVLFNNAMAGGCYIQFRFSDKKIRYCYLTANQTKMVNCVSA